jgi:hypothetical protein
MFLAGCHRFALKSNLTIARARRQQRQKIFIKNGGFMEKLRLTYEWASITSEPPNLINALKRCEDQDAAMVRESSSKIKQLKTNPATP